MMQFEAQEWDVQLRSPSGDALSNAKPDRGGRVCPECGAPSLILEPLTLRSSLVRLLEAHMSENPTATIDLALRIHKHQSGPFDVTADDVKVLEAAYKANGPRFLDTVRYYVRALIDGALEPTPRQSE